MTTALDKRVAEVGEEIKLRIKVIGAKGNLQAPRLPGFKDIDTFYTGRSSHFAFVNNESTSSVEFSYVLIARKEGKLTLNPIGLSIAGQNFQTEPIVLTIQGEGARATLPQAPVPPSSYSSASSTNSAQSSNAPTLQSAPPGEDDNIFVQAWLDKKSVYPNEQLLLSYSLYTRYDTRYEGFWIEEFPQEREVRRETVRVNGMRYVKAEVKKIALFPTAAAEYTINPGALKVSIRREPQNRSVFDEFFNDSFFSGGNFFSRRENRLMRPEPIQIQVKPLPERGQPASFQGAVGNFQVSASLEKQSVKQNEPLTLKIIIEGEGNIETLNRPQIPDLPDVKVYDSDTSSELFKTGYVIGGRKTFETVFIPTQAGDMVIPALEFSFFNPETETYEVRKTPEYKVFVEKSKETFQLPKELSGENVFKKEIEREGKDIRFIHERLPTHARAEQFNLIFKGLVVGNGVLFVMLLFGFWRSWQERIFEKDSGLKRRRFAKHEAERKYRRLQKLANSTKQDDRVLFFDEVDKTLTQYLSDRFNLSRMGITRMELEAKVMETLGGEDPLYKEIISVYETCDQSRFAKSSHAREEKEKAMKTLKDAIQRMEKLK